MGSLSRFSVRWNRGEGARRVRALSYMFPQQELILQHNGFDVLQYRQSIYRLFESGGGKGMNHLYIGPPSSGKTALTRALLVLFGEGAFVKPQVGTSLALQVGAKLAGPGGGIQR